jgi:hypothetical protein
MSRQKGSCHCGQVRFEAEVGTTEGLACNCSICGRKGSLLAFVPESQFQLLSGKEFLTDYQFGAKKIHHTFCSTCGVSAFATGAMPDGTPVKAINLRCIEGLDLDEVKINSFDGRSL